MSLSPSTSKQEESKNEALISETPEKTEYKIDKWFRSIEKIFEFCQIPLCYGIKISMVALNLSTTCVFLAACLIVSLKLILVAENGFITGTESQSSSLFMLFCLLFMTLVSWAFTTTIIVSRQIEVLMLIYMAPSTLPALKLAETATKETDPDKQQFIRFTPSFIAKVPYPKFPMMTIFAIIMLVFFVLTIGLFMSGHYPTGSFFLIWSLIVFSFICIWFNPIKKKVEINRPANSMVSYPFLGTWIFMAVGGFITSILFLTMDPAYNESDYGAMPAFGKIVLGFVGSSAVLNLIHVVREAWVYPVYYTWLEFTAKLFKTEPSTHNICQKSTFIFGIVLALVGLILGFIAFITYMTDGDSTVQQNTALASEIIFCIINISTCFAAMFVYASAKSTETKKLKDGSQNDTMNPITDPIVIAVSNEPAVHSEQDDFKSAVAVSDIEGGVIQNGNTSKFAAIMNAFQSIGESSEFLLTIFVFFIFLIAGLGAAGATASTWVQAIVYFFFGTIFMCSAYYPIETKNNDSYNDEFWKIVQMILLFLCILLIVCVFPIYGAGISSAFFILAFSHGFMLLLFDLLLSAPFPLVSDHTIQRNLKVFAFTEEPAAEFSPLSVEKYNDRMFKGIYGLAVVLNSIAFLLSTYAQTTTFFGAGSGAATVVSPLDVNASTTPQYGLCSEKLYGLNPIDTTYLVALTYFKDPTNYSYDCGYYNPNNLKTCLDHYFTQTYTNPSTNNKPYNWEVLNVTIPKNDRASAKTAYYGIKSDNANLIVVGVRGSTTGRDWLEDFNLYVEVTMLQVFSLLIPYIYVWPVAATGQFVKALSFIDALTFLGGNRSYYEPVVDYISGLQLQYPNYSFTVIGHSLGGATSGIVGAKMNIRSFNVEPPGTIYSALKFKIPNGLQPIHQSSTSIVRDYDPVPMVDLQVIIKLQQ